MTCRVALLVGVLALASACTSGDEASVPSTDVESTTTVTTARESIDLSSRVSASLAVTPSELGPGGQFHLDHSPADVGRSAVVYLSPAWDVENRVYGLGSVAVSDGQAQRLDDPTTPWTIPGILVTAVSGDDFILPDDIEPGAWLGCYADDGPCFQIVVREPQ